MGSTSPPQTPSPKKQSLPPSPAQPSTTSASDIAAELTVSELRHLLELRDQEIQVLKFELEKYKLALHQSQLDYHYIQNQQQHDQSNDDKMADDNMSSLLEDTPSRERQSLGDVGALVCDGDDEDDENENVDNNKNHDEDSDNSVHDDEEDVTDQRHSDQDNTENIVVIEPNTKNLGKMLYLHNTTSICSGTSVPGSRVVFKAGDDDDDDNLNQNDSHQDNHHHHHYHHHNKEQGKKIDNLEGIIHDVGEIDLSLELKVADSKEQQKKSKEDLSNQHNGVAHEEDEDGISDGLLTSLTDAAINNLSQLAALQERCESQQQQHSHQYQQQSQQAQQQHHQQQQQGQQQPRARSRQQASLGLLANLPASIGAAGGSSSSAAAATNSPSLRPIDISKPNDEFSHDDPFSTSAIASQAAIAISAAAGNAQPSSMISQSKQQPVSSSSSISPNSNLQASEDLNLSHSLANVVAAAAIAAAAANDQQHHHSHLSQLNPQATRLISSALPSPEFYHSLHQHHPHIHSHAQNIPHQQQPSPVTSLHFSPSTSVTPSPSSLMAQSRRSASNTSSNLMSPISSPNYLRRQFMPDRLPLLSPSPTSGLITGPSSGGSSSLAHILHQQHQQQRSASVLTPSSGTPMSGTGSTAVSPLMSNKNSSQARLNNMQIRHKFGYLGSGRAQFNSPHGFCLGLNQEIVVADTNNHRVCIFDKSGSYITQFGSPGKEEGQLWNPRKVAILHRPINNSNTSASSNTQLQQSHLHLHLQHQLHNQASSVYSSHVNNTNIQNSGQLSSCSNEPLYVVCDRGAERSRMQLFTKDGAFIKKIGIHYIDIVAGLAITQNGLIIVVDSVSPTVYIINGETGILNGWFDCSGHMKEPSDIAVKSDVPGNEYFICDFKGHCVVVFSEQGEYLRKIGHDGLTSYPNGIDISDDGDILVGDSHGNRFHVVVFDRNGNFVSQFECPHVKVSRCCGLKITREGYIVTLAKNNHHVLVLDTIHI